MERNDPTIPEEVYDRLRAHRRQEESFTASILRLTTGDRDVQSGFGAMEDVEGFREAVAGTRNQFDHDLRTRTEW